MDAIEFHLRTRVVFGPRSLDRLGAIASELGFCRTLLVSDRGIVAAGHTEAASRILRSAGIDVAGFHDFTTNPDSAAVESGRAFAQGQNVDSIIALGGGSSLDCAKGINFVLTNGGRMEDYRGYGKATQPLLPMIGIPTTAGTGSEAQSYALITHAETRAKMACGDPQAAFRVAILDPCLLVSQPAEVRATAGCDAVSHAVETYVTTRRNPFSEVLSREAWRLLEANYLKVLDAPHELDALGAMQMGAYLAGAAIEHSMLGATHACANPLTARYGTAHGVAIALLLPHVVRWNGSVARERYSELLEIACLRQGFGGQARTSTADGAAGLARLLEEFAAAGGLPASIRQAVAQVSENDLPALAADAAEQWTGRYNPRPFDAAGALEVYRCAY